MDLVWDWYSLEAKDGARLCTFCWCGISAHWAGAMVGMPAASSGHRPNMTDLVSRDSGDLGLVAEKAIQLPMVSKVMEIGSFARIPSSTSLMADGSEVLVSCGVCAAATNSDVCPRNPATNGFGLGGGKLVFGLESIMGLGPKIGF